MQLVKEGKYDGDDPVLAKAAAGPQTRYFQVAQCSICDFCKALKKVCCTEAVRGASGPSAHAGGLSYWRSRRLAAQTNPCVPSLAEPWGVSAQTYVMRDPLWAGVVVNSNSSQCTYQKRAGSRSTRL